MYTVYILHSEMLGRYYAGYTAGNVVDRLARHLCNHGGFTSTASDWKVAWTKEFEEKRQAILEERRIKKRGIGRYLTSLAK